MLHILQKVVSCWGLLVLVSKIVRRSVVLDADVRLNFSLGGSDVANHLPHSPTHFVQRYNHKGLVAFVVSSKFVAWFCYFLSWFSQHETHPCDHVYRAGLK